MGRGTRERRRWTECQAGHRRTGADRWGFLFSPPSSSLSVPSSSLSTAAHLLPRASHGAAQDQPGDGAGGRPGAARWPCLSLASGAGLGATAPCCRTGCAGGPGTAQGPCAGAWPRAARRPKPSRRAGRAGGAGGRAAAPWRTGRARPPARGGQQWNAGAAAGIEGGRGAPAAG